MPEDLGSDFLQGYFKNAEMRQQAKQFQAEIALRQQGMQLEQQKFQLNQGQYASEAALRQAQIANLSDDNKRAWDTLQQNKSNQQQQRDLAIAALAPHGRVLPAMQAGPQVPGAIGVQQQIPNQGLPLGQGQVFQPYTPQDLAQQKIQGEQLEQQAHYTSAVDSVNKLADISNKLGVPMDAQTLRAATAEQMGGEHLASVFTDQMKDQNKPLTPGEAYVKLLGADSGTAQNVLAGHVTKMVTQNPQLLGDPKFHAAIQQAKQSLLNFQSAGAQVSAAPAIAREASHQSDIDNYRQLTVDMGVVDPRKHGAAASAKLEKLKATGKYSPEAVKLYEEGILKQEKAGEPQSQFGKTMKDMDVNKDEDTKGPH